MEEARDFGPLTVYFSVEKAHTATTKLMFYVMGSTPIFRARNYENRPVGRAKTYTSLV